MKLAFALFALGLASCGGDKSVPPATNLQSSGYQLFASGLEQMPNEPALSQSPDGVAALAALKKNLFGIGVATVVSRLGMEYTLQQSNRIQIPSRLSVPRVLEASKSPYALEGRETRAQDIILSLDISGQTRRYVFVPDYNQFGLKLHSTATVALFESESSYEILKVQYRSVNPQMQRFQIKELQGVGSSSKYGRLLYVEQENLTTVIQTESQQ